MAVNRTIKHPGASQKVLAYLRDNPGVVIPYAEIERALGYPSYAISNAINTLRVNKIPVQRPAKGMVIYQPMPQEKSKGETNLFEYVGSTKGYPIVRGEDHEMYVLFPLHEIMETVMRNAR